MDEEGRGGEGDLELVIGAGTDRARVIRLARGRARRLVRAVLGAALLAGLVLAVWPFAAARIWRAAELEREVLRLERERERVAVLAETLAEVEAAYERIREMYAPEVVPEVGASWLPPAGGRGPVSTADEDDRTPSSWPLAERGFLTQTPFETGGGVHAGIDIAVPTGSYIRAAGPGLVTAAADHPVYGLHVVLNHANGYRSLYAHAAMLRVVEGDQVRRGEVIGLTGSTGRSTAPHLHFEVSRDGEEIDPLTLVRQP